MYIVNFFLFCYVLDFQYTFSGLKTLYIVAYNIVDIRGKHRVAKIIITKHARMCTHTHTHTHTCIHAYSHTNTHKFNIHTNTHTHTTHTHRAQTHYDSLEQVFNRLHRNEMVHR